MIDWKAVENELPKEDAGSRGILIRIYFDEIPNDPEAFEVAGFSKDESEFAIIIEEKHHFYKSENFVTTINGFKAVLTHWAYIDTPKLR